MNNFYQKNLTSSFPSTNDEWEDVGELKKSEMQYEEALKWYTTVNT